MAALQAADPCSRAQISASQDQRLVQLSDGSIEPGSTLAISSDIEGTYEDVRIMLVPSQGIFVQSITEALRLNQTGLFSVHLQYSAAGGSTRQQCLLLPKLVVECGSGKQEVDSVCKPIQNCSASAGLWFDEPASRCRKRPLMTVRSADPRLFVVVPKAKSGTVVAAQAEVRLARGDVDSDKESRISWSARTLVSWLHVLTPTGEVYSDAPVTTLSVAVDVSGLNDTRCTGPVRAAISVMSSLGGESAMFENGSSTVLLEVEVAIEAAVYIAAEDLAVSTSEATILQSGGAIVSGETLLASVAAFDHERLAIQCGGLLIRLRLTEKSTGLVRSLELQYRDGNTYHSEVPSSWIEKSGVYALTVEGVPSDANGRAGSGGIVLLFSVENSSFQIYVGAALASALTLSAALFGYLVYRKRGSLQRMRAAALKLLGNFWAVCLLFLDVWDVLGPPARSLPWR